jgi:hypothetical protein
MEILLDPSEYNQLKQYAKKEHKPIATLIREAIREKYLSPSLKKKKNASDWLISQKDEFGDWEGVKKDIVKSKIKRLPNRHPENFSNF